MANKKGSAFGYPFLFFSIVFYAFLGFLMTQGADKYLITTIPNYNAVNTSTLGTIGAILTNPLSGYGFLAWLSVAMFIVDVYIILSSIT